MFHDNPTPRLRTTLALDGVACLAMGAGLATLSGFLGSHTDLSPTFLQAAGLLLLPIGAFILAVAMRREIPGWGVALIVAGNAGWVLASLILPLVGLIQPNILGLVLVIGQAVAVAVLAGLEQAYRPHRKGQILQA
jgi:hypothetical protein